MSVSRATVLAVAALLAAGTAHAQRPTVSRALDNAFATDSTRIVWLFARPTVPLGTVRALVSASGGRVRRTSRWLHAVSAMVNAQALDALRARPELRHIQPVVVFVRPRMPVPSPAPTLAGAGAPAAGLDSTYGPSAMPFRVMNIFALVARGYRGAGVRIAIFDAGFETELATFAQAKVIAQYDFVFNDSIVRDQPQDTTAGGTPDGASTHGTATWSLLAGVVPDSLIGVAPDAEYILAKTEDVRSETKVEEDNYVAALEWADSLGAKIVSSSIGYRTFDGGVGYTFSQLNGDVAVTTVAADAAAARGITVVTAMGNAGPASRSLETPADGDSVISVGAVDSLGVLASFSSRGPTADLRIKPDVTAPGVAIWTRVPDYFMRWSGTSFSTPLTAGAAALIEEIHPTFGPIDIRDALRKAGSNAASPDTLQGWGMPDVTVAATFPRGVAVTLPAGTTFTSVTPRFDWTVADVPTFANPVTYRLRMSADTTFHSTVLDTALNVTSFAIASPLKPGTTRAIEVTATAADSAVFRVRSPIAYTTPPWVTLTTLDDPAGSTIRDVRPQFTWSSPDVATPPGPFLYRIAIIRADDGVVEDSADSVQALSFVPDHDLERNTPYLWRVTALLGSDSTVTTSRGAFLIVDETVPAITALFQNFPNPFPNTTTGLTSTCFWFDLAHDGAVRLDILDLRGHLVRTLLPNAQLGPTLAAGRYGRPAIGASNQCDPNLTWDGTASDGETVAPGIYLAKLSTPDGVFFKRIVFLGAR